MRGRSLAGHLAILAAGLAAPFVFPAHSVQFAIFWILVLFAQTWDTMGGQMGYNSLGNITFFGLGMYVCALTQIGLYYNIGEYTAANGAIKIDFTTMEYFKGLFARAPAGGDHPRLRGGDPLWVLFGLRGPYFAIGTLGVAIAAAELTNAWGWVGGGQRDLDAGLPRRPRDARALLLLRLHGRGGALLPLPAVAVLDALQPRPQRHPRRRGQGRGARPAHGPLQDGRLVGLGLLPRHRRGRCSAT